MPSAPVIRCRSTNPDQDEVMTENERMNDWQFQSGMSLTGPSYRSVKYLACKSKHLLRNATYATEYSVGSLICELVQVIYCCSCLAVILSPLNTPAELVSRLDALLFCSSDSKEASEHINEIGHVY